MSRAITKGNKKGISQIATQLWQACDTLVGIEEETAKAAKAHLLKDQAELLAERKRLSDALAVLKQERISDQKKLLDLQRRLGYAMEQFEQDKTKMLDCDNLMGIDIKGEENMMKDRVDDIMGSLKDKMVASARENPSESNPSRLANKAGTAQRSTEMESNGMAKREKKKSTAQGKHGH